MAVDKKFAIDHENTLKTFSEELEKQLKAYTAEQMVGAMEEFMEDVKESMEVYVPERTQQTKNSWYSEVRAKDGMIYVNFGHDKNNEFEYIPFIYMGMNTEEQDISFRKASARPYWLEPAVAENIHKLNDKLSKPKGK